MTTEAKPKDDLAAVKDIWAIAEEPTEFKAPGSAPMHDWTTDNKTPAAPGETATTSAPVDDKPKYTDEYFRTSGKNSAKMTAQILTLGLTGFNHWFMRWRARRILSDDEAIALREKEEKEPEKLTVKEKLLIKRIDRILDSEDKLKDEIKFKESEEHQLSDSFYEYQKFTNKPLPPSILIWFNIGIKILKVLNAYIFA
jgi:hypothetical protein